MPPPILNSTVRPMMLTPSFPRMMAFPSPLMFRSEAALLVIWDKRGIQKHHKKHIQGLWKVIRPIHTSESTLHKLHVKVFFPCNYDTEESSENDFHIYKDTKQTSPHLAPLFNTHKLWVFQGWCVFCRFVHLLFFLFLSGLSFLSWRLKWSIRFGFTFMVHIFDLYFFVALLWIGILIPKQSMARADVRYQYIFCNYTISVMFAI